MFKTPKFEINQLRCTLYTVHILTLVDLPLHLMNIAWLTSTLSRKPSRKKRFFFIKKGGGVQGCIKLTKNKKYSLS